MFYFTITKAKKGTTKRNMHSLIIPEFSNNFFSRVASLKRKLSIEERPSCGGKRK